MKVKNTGFTLIELLIVIALLGALAVGLLATVDPFEQLKKGTDTSRRNTTSEVYNAMIRYYSVKSAFPWGVAPVTAKALNATDMSTWIQAVQSAGELKPDFLSLAGSDNLGKIFVTSTSDSTGSPNTITVCFEPESKSFRAEANAKYTNAGSVYTTGCLSQTSNGSACFWCIK